MNIPRPDHPVWRRLVTGEMLFQPSFLGACMFLARVRAERRRPDGRSHTAAHMGQLRAIYARNQDCGTAQRDLAILRVNEIFTMDPDCGGWFQEDTWPGGTDIPLPDHPVWNGLVTGAIPFQPSFLGASLFLTRVRTEPRRGDDRDRTALHTGRLRALYAYNAECTSAQRDLVRLVWMKPAVRGRSAALARRRAHGYEMTVLAADGREYDLPADTVTRDDPASGSRGPYVPLAFRSQGDVFYVSSSRWPELSGAALRLRYAYGPLARPASCRPRRS
jgi:hypothetical protein